MLALFQGSRKVWETSNTQRVYIIAAENLNSSGILNKSFVSVMFYAGKLHWKNCNSNSIILYNMIIYVIGYAEFFREYILKECYSYNMYILIQQHYTSNLNSQRDVTPTFTVSVLQVQRNSKIYAQQIMLIEL